ncbi:hypothetical protein FRC01_013915, partial [Tulasnella sp. 417]
MTSRSIVIIGGNGKIAQRLTKLLVSSGHQHRITSIIRSPSQVDSIKALSPELVTPLVLSLESSQPADYTKVFEETAADVVYFIAGGSGKPGENGETVLERTRKVDYQGSIMIYDALEAVSGKKPRLIMISALDIRAPDAPFPDHYDEADRALSARIREVHPVYYEWKYKADLELVRRTGFKWTIIRPGGLTEEPGAGSASIGRTHLTSRVSRDDVARVLFYLLDREDASGLAIDVAGGSSDIESRLEEVIKK